MADKLQLEAEVRTDIGKGASRRLRHADKVPAIIYGAGKDPQPLVLEHNKVIKALENEEYYSQIITLKVDKREEQAVLKALQRHPYKPKVTHMDFLRIKAGEEITMQIPLHFIGEEDSPGVKQNGTISHHISEVEIRCLPVNLPKYIEVDVSAMDLDDSIHLSSLKMPKGVDLATPVDEEHDQPVISIHLAKIAEEPKAVPEEEGEEAAPESEAAEATKE